MYFLTSADSDAKLVVIAKMAAQVRMLIHRVCLGITNATSNRSQASDASSSVYCLGVTGGFLAVMSQPAPPALQSARLTLVGNICTQWSHIEYQIATVIWWLLKLDRDTGMIVTGGLDMLPRMNMAINLCRHLKADAKLDSALLATRKAIQDGLDGERNRAVHGVWFDLRGDGAHGVEVHRGKGGRQRHYVSGDELLGTGTALNTVSSALSVVLDEVGITDWHSRLLHSEKNAF